MPVVADRARDVAERPQVQRRLPARALAHPFGRLSDAVAEIDVVPEVALGGTVEVLRARHEGHVAAVAGDFEGRQVLILVEWSSREAFDGYVSDPALADLHRHRERGTARYVWQLFDRLDDLRPLLKK